VGEAVGDPWWVVLLVKRVGSVVGRLGEEMKSTLKTERADDPQWAGSQISKSFKSNLSITHHEDRRKSYRMHLPHASGALGVCNVIETVAATYNSSSSAHLL
jgi:hypothetical protein